jgi:hypothetical protein
MKTIGYIVVYPDQKVILTKFIISPWISQTHFDELITLFKGAFPSARWDRAQSMWILPIDTLIALRVFYIALFGSKGYKKVEKVGAYRQLGLF